MSHSVRQGFSPPHAEPRLDRAARRASGIYYTPPELVRWIVARSLDVLMSDRNDDTSAPLRVLDPACGAGAFLLDAAEQIRKRGLTLRQAELTGVDLSPEAVTIAKQQLGRQTKLSSGDFLLDDRSPGPFDLIIGNPPYVSIRQLAKAQSLEYRQKLRERFRTARGNFDLYPLFLERSWELLRPGGVCGMIIPNKWAGLDYARPLRELLLAETKLCEILDLSSADVFSAAGVYPHVLIWQKRRVCLGEERAADTRRDRIIVREVLHPRELSDAALPVRFLQQSLLSPRSISLRPPLDVESRVTTQPLGERATLHSGASGYAAEALAELLQEAGNANRPRPGFADFIVSGNIDRYAIRLGNVRYMGRRFTRPVLSLDAPELSVAKRHLYRSPKLVISGMSRRLEAACDERGLALGVQVYAAVNPLDDPLYLLALLNSRLMSFLFRERFAAKQLAGGYLAINKGQLAELPIRVVGPGDKEDQRRVVRIVKLVCRNPLLRVGPAKAGHYELECEVDSLVYQLYRLAPAEIVRVDSAFDTLRAKAA